MEDDRFETDVLIETNRHCLGKLEVLYREVCERCEREKSMGCEEEKSKENEEGKNEIIKEENREEGKGEEEKNEEKNEKNEEKNEKIETEKNEKIETEKNEKNEEKNEKIETEKNDKTEEEKTETHEQSTPIKLADTALSAVDKRAIRRLYGKGVDEVVMMMLTLAPKTTIPVLMKRMREKEEQWMKEKCVLEAVGQAATREA